MPDLNQILFATSNQNKVKEASKILGYTLNTPELKIDIPEIQLESKHWKEVELGNYTFASDYVASRKAVDAEKAYDQPALIEDIAFYIPALKGRPGTDIKAWCNDELMTVLCRLAHEKKEIDACLLYTSPSPRDRTRSRMPSSA